MYGGNAASGPNFIVNNGAVAVPPDFVGLHFRAWPIFNASFWATAGQPYPTAPSPAPAGVGFGSYRTHDSGYAFWYQIETSPGVYDWTGLDTLVSTHRTAGRTVDFCVSGTPNFYLSASNPAKGTLNFFGSYPDSTAPNGLTAAGTFVTALITRYNTAGGGWATLANGSGTNWSVLGKGIQTFELWNEPTFSGSNGFFFSPVGQFIDLAYTMKTAAKAVDASIAVVSPGFIAPNTMQMFLQGTGTINTGVTGLSLCDAICIHYYHVLPPCVGFNTYNAEITGSTSYLKTVIATCGGSLLPVWCTESGFDDTYPTDGLALIAAQTPLWRYQWWARILMTAAALGYKKWMSYAWDTPYLLYPDSDPAGSAKAISDIHQYVAGKTITSAFYDVGGAVTLRFSDGSSFSV